MNNNEDGEFLFSSVLNFVPVSSSNSFSSIYLASDLSMNWNFLSDQAPGLFGGKRFQAKAAINAIYSFYL